MKQNDSKEMVRTAFDALSDKKGEDIRIIDIGNVSVIADYFIIASGSNNNQVQALVDHVQDALNKKGYEMKHLEGYQSGNWILLDYGDIIVHVFSKEDRLFYDLERIWKDGTSVAIEDIK